MNPTSFRIRFEPPEGPVHEQPTVNPLRQLAPLLATLKYNPLPNPLPDALQRRMPEFTPTHALSMHMFPAAYPRAPSTYDGIDFPNFGFDKAGKKQWLSEAARTLLNRKKEAENSVPDPNLNLAVPQGSLWTTALRIRRKLPCSNGTKGMTLVALHPNGFHKETWEPSFKRLLEATESSPGSVHIDEIWALDATNHGDAALLNKGYLPDLPDRADYARDLANFLINYLPETSVAFGQDLPLELEHVAPSIGAQRVNQGFADRTVVGLGHSLGGDATVICALSYPKLFSGSALILLETTLFPPSNNNEKRKVDLLASTLGRTSSWSSRDEAKNSFLSSSLFKPFHPDVFTAYVEHGTYLDKATGRIRLKCDPIHEAGEFAEHRTMNEGWELLPTLDDSIHLHWIMGGTEEASRLVGGSKVARRTVWRRMANSSNVRIEGGGHLIVQEKPIEVANEIVDFLASKFGKQQNHSKL